MLADPRTHNNAFITALSGKGFAVGDATYPTTAHGWAGTPGQSAFTPYVIVYPLTQAFDGSIGCPESDSDVGWQVTCVGATREQCDWVKASVDSTIIGHTLSVSGRFVPRVRPVEGYAAENVTRRDDTVQPAVFIATPRYMAMTVEAQ